jgi:hypothetical protein
VEEIGGNGSRWEEGEGGEQRGRDVSRVQRRRLGDGEGVDSSKKRGLLREAHRNTEKII